MGEVVSITKNQPYIQGECKCLSCGHEHQAAVPIGTIAVECPNCGLNKSCLNGVAATEYMYECFCGSMHFVLSADLGVLCANCGTEHNNWMDD